MTVQVQYCGISFFDFFTTVLAPRRAFLERIIEKILKHSRFIDQDRSALSQRKFGGNDRMKIRELSDQFFQKNKAAQFPLRSPLLPKSLSNSSKAALISSVYVSWR